MRLDKITQIFLMFTAASALFGANISVESRANPFGEKASRRERIKREVLSKSSDEATGNDLSEGADLCKKYNAIYSIDTATDLNLIVKRIEAMIQQEEHRAKAARGSMNAQDYTFGMNGDNRLVSKENERRNGAAALEKAEQALKELKEALSVVEFYRGVRKGFTLNQKPIKVVNNKGQCAKLYPVSAEAGAVIFYDSNLRRYSIELEQMSGASEIDCFNAFIDQGERSDSIRSAMAIAGAGESSCRQDRFGEIAYKLIVTTGESGKMLDIINSIPSPWRASSAKLAAESIAKKNPEFIDRAIALIRFSEKSAQANLYSIISKSFPAGKQEVIQPSIQLNLDVLEPFMSANEHITLADYHFQSGDIDLAELNYKKAQFKGATNADELFSGKLKQVIDASFTVGASGVLYGIIPCSIEQDSKLEDSIPGGCRQLTVQFASKIPARIAERVEIEVESGMIAGGKSIGTEKNLQIPWEKRKLKELKKSIDDSLKISILYGGRRIVNKVIPYKIEPCTTLPLRMGSVDTGFLSAAYVNEDSSTVLDVIQRAKESHLTSSLGGDDSMAGFVKDMVSICHVIRLMKITYVSEGGSAGGTSTTKVQYVKPMPEIVKTKSANCIDGTILLASILKKLGHNVSLIRIPGHVFIAVCGNDHISGIEVTSLALNNRINEDAQISLDKTKAALLQAYEEGESQLKQSIENNTATIYNVGAVRKDGLRSIGW